MRELHNKLLQHSRRYRRWHEHPYHQHHHWLVFLLAFLLSSYAVAAAWTTTVQELSILNIPSFAPAPAHAQTQSRFFRQHSTWYEKIPQNPSITPNSTNYVSDILTNSSSLAVNNTIWSHTIWYADATTPLTDVILTHQRNFKYDFIIDNGWDKNIPIPLNARPPGAFDDHVVVVNPNKDYAWDFNRFENRGNGVFAADLVFGWDLNGDGIDCPPLGEGPPWNNATLGRSPRVASTPLSHGIITREEIERGSIDHAVAFAYWGSAEGRGVYPSCISNAELNPRPWALKLGMRLQLDPNLDINSLGLNRAGKIIARALQEYGMIFVENDGIGSNSVYAESFTGKSISWNDPGPDGQPLLRSSDTLPIPLDRFRVITSLMPPFAGDPPSSCTHYASPSGGGNGTSISSPFQISDFWSVASPGKTLCLLDGTYRGDQSMINPPENLNGTASQPITIRALNDGKVTIDGEDARRPVHLRYNDYFILEGFNAHSGSWYVVEVSRGADNNIVRRVVAWDANRNQNVMVFGSNYNSDNLFEDIAGWGWGRKIIEGFSDTNTTFRRCFFRWSGHTHAGGTYRLGTTFSYYSTNSLHENCIGTWDMLPESMDSPENLAVFGFDRDVGGGHRVLGSIGYLVSGQKRPPYFIFFGPGDSRLDLEAKDIFAYSDVPGVETIALGQAPKMRYVNGTLTNTPLWPWPMNERIKQAMIQSGYDKKGGLDGKGGTDLTKTVFELDGGTLPPDWDGDGEGDTAVCDNGVCEAGETASSCPADCGTTNQPPRNLFLRYLGPTP